MVAYLKNKNNQWYCSNCMMRQDIIYSACSFCGQQFVNFEEVCYNNWKDIEDEKTYIEYPSNINNRVG